MQGIYIDGRRPKSKKEIKEAIESNPHRVQIEATSMFGNEFDGFADELAEEFNPITFVGPDPYTKRNFYGNILRVKGRLVVK